MRPNPGWEKGFQSREKCPFSFKALPCPLFPAPPPSREVAKDPLAVTCIRKEEARGLRAGDLGRQLIALQGTRTAGFEAWLFPDYLETQLFRF